MAGAFTSIADDASALFWNPAGLAQLERQEVIGTHADLFQTGTKDDYVALVLPLSPSFSGAVDWYRSGFNDDELNFAENRFDLGCGVRIRKSIWIGTTVKYISRVVDLDEFTVRDGDGFGADVGLLFKPLPRLSLGLLGQDLFNTRLRYQAEGSSVVYGRSWRAGVSYAPSRLGTVAFDWDDRYHAGLELTPLKILALRAGLENDWDGAERVTATFGAGLKVGGFRFDYARIDHPLLSSTSHFGLSLAFNFNPARVRIENLEAKPIYLSLHRSYDHEPLGTVRLHNLEDEAIVARVSVHIPEFAASPSEQDFVVRPHATQEFPLTAVLSDRVMELRADRVVPIHVAVTYPGQRLQRTERKSARSMAFAPGTINWSEGVGQAAAFVTTHDPIVDSFAREAAQSVLFRERDPFGNRNLSFAAAVIDALGVLGVVYMPDPTQPYSSIPDTPNAIDTIQYPRQTLQRRTGDCDDTSVLVASMLANLGVRTKFVDAPGHLFLAVSTGVHARNRSSLGLSEDLHLVDDDEVWIPLETTALHLGFAESWRRGADQYAVRSARDRLSLVDVAENHLRYEPAEPRGIAFAAPALDARDLRTRVDRDARTVESWRAEYVGSRFGEFQRPSASTSPGALNELAHVYLTTGKWTESRYRLESLLAQEPGSARARNNLAIICVVEGDLEKALSNLESAAASDSSDPGIWLNLGLTRQLVGDTLRAQAALGRGVDRTGGLGPAAQLLGLPMKGEAPPSTRKVDVAADTRALILAWREELAARTALGAGDLPAASGTPAAPSERRSPTFEGAAGGSAVQELLYWKE